MYFFRQMKSPAITATVEGKNKTLYLQVISLCFHTVLCFQSEMCPDEIRQSCTFWFELTFSWYFVLQSVASIEQRTRPNLSKTLKGEVLYLLNMFPKNGNAYILNLLGNYTVNMLTHFCYKHVFPELGLSDRQELAVADATTPQTMLFRLCFTS